MKSIKGIKQAMWHTGVNKNSRKGVNQAKDF
jgi:hypothetical protein